MPFHFLPLRIRLLSNNTHISFEAETVSITVNKSTLCAENAEGHLASKDDKESPIIKHTLISF